MTSPIRGFKANALSLTLLLTAIPAVAGEKVECAPVENSAGYETARTMAGEGYLNLAFFSLDRTIQASAKKPDSSEFVAAVSCLTKVYDKNSLIDLPNYDSQLTAVAARAKAPEAQTAIANYSFRSILQRTASGATSEKSLSALMALIKSSPYYTSAANGLVASAKNDHAAAKSALRQAIALTPEAEVKGALKGELKLALARSLYASGENAAAITEYESLYKIGMPMQDALIESAWAHLRVKNYVKAIGLSYELSTGKLTQFFAPEAPAIRAIGFVENCRFAEARSVVTRFSNEYVSLSEWLKANSKKSEPLYEMAMARAEGAIGDDSFPARVWSMWSSSDLFVSLQSSIRAAFAEERDAAEWIEEKAANAASKASLISDVKKIAQLRSRGAARIESHLEKLNQGMSERINRESERMRFVRIEANQGAGRDLVYRNANPGLADVEKKVAKVDRKAKSYKGKLDWGKVKAEDPAAEMWIDEIGNFEAATLDRCKAKAVYKSQHGVEVRRGQ